MEKENPRYVRASWFVLQEKAIIIAFTDTFAHGVDDFVICKK